MHTYMCMHAFTYLYVETLTDKRMCTHAYTQNTHTVQNTHTHIYLYTRYMHTETYHPYIYWQKLTVNNILLKYEKSFP